MSRKVMPLGKNAPKLCPAEPSMVMSMVSSGKPSGPHALVTRLPSMVPTVRFTLRIGTLNFTGLQSFIASDASSISCMSRALSKLWSWALEQ